MTERDDRPRVILGAGRLLVGPIGADSTDPAAWHEAGLASGALSFADPEPEHDDDGRLSALRFRAHRAVSLRVSHVSVETIAAAFGVPVWMLVTVPWHPMPLRIDGHEYRRRQRSRRR